MSATETETPPLVIRSGTMVLVDSDPASPPGEVEIDVGEGEAFKVVGATPTHLSLGRPTKWHGENRVAGQLHVTGAVLVYDDDRPTTYQFPLNPGTYEVIAYGRDGHVGGIKVVRA